MPMLRCREVVDLLGTERWREEPLRHRLALAVHLAMCRFCRGYLRELRRIGAAARRLAERHPEDDRFIRQLTQAVRREAERTAAAREDLHT